MNYYSVLSAGFAAGVFVASVTIGLYVFLPKDNFNVLKSSKNKRRRKHRKYSKTSILNQKNYDLPSECVKKPSNVLTVTNRPIQTNSTNTKEKDDTLNYDVNNMTEKLTSLSKILDFEREHIRHVADEIKENLLWKFIGKTLEEVDNYLQENYKGWKYHVLEFNGERRSPHTEKDLTILNVRASDKRNVLSFDSIFEGVVGV